MKKLVLFFLLLLGLVLSGYIIYRLSNSTRVKILLMDSKMKERAFEPVLGIYDRENKLTQFNPAEFRHFALVLNSDEKWEIEENLLNALPKDAPVILTVEFWDIGVLKKVSSGEYDQNIEQLFSNILKDRTNVFLRWNPEMEVPAMNLPWAGSPDDFIDSFKKFSAELKKISPATKVVFSPAGYPGVLEFYPGETVVDASSITINSDSENHITTYREDSPPAQLRRKLHRLRFIDHPVFVLGSRNLNNGFKDEWVTEAFDNLRKNSKIIYSSENFEHPKALPPVTEKQEFIVGFYDPKALLVDEKEVSVEHIFLNFTQIKTGDLQQKLEIALCRDNDLILTVEPGIHDNEIRDNNVLSNILKGKYDDIISKFYSAISGIDRQIYLRFAHEMEIPITRYAWQSKDPLEYINAFRYFMQFPESDMPHIKRIWGPAGDRGSIEFWPGNDVVDYISISVYGLPDKNITDPEKQETFSQIFHRKTRRFRFIDKPFFITEFGVKGDDQFQAEWLVDAAKTLNEQPQVIGVNYFNMTDVPQAWGEIQPPDWSISKETFFTFLEALQRDDLQTAENF